MAYKRITIMDIYEIIRRWHDRQSISHIADMLSYDRKTVRKYVNDAKAIGICLEQPLPPKEQVLSLLNETARINRRAPKAQQLFKPYVDEIASLINDNQYPLKLKQAFEVISERHDLVGNASYASFTRFVKAKGITIFPHRSTCRMEVEAGNEVQLDYARMGLLYDPLSQKKRTVYAFIATLSHSRHKYVEFVYKQDQASFVASHVKMLDYFGGVPVRMVLDNLKSGVIKADLYDPQFNRSYREMAEYYGCFLDPCRVTHAKDKGKVERDVQTVRNQFRKLLALNNQLDIGQANQKIKTWCIDEYGQKPHGTTQQPPYQVFINQEQPQLKPLPQEPFAIPRWKAVWVHADHYVQFDKKAYSAPHAYVGQQLWLRQVNNLIQLFHQGQLIKQHVVTERFRHTDWSDFPDNVKAALDEGLPALLQSRAATVGPLFQQLIRQTLQPHAFLNLRRAQGLIRLMDHYEHQLIEQAAAYALGQHIAVTPKTMKQLLQRIIDHNQSSQGALSVSQQTLEFVRAMDYFIHDERVTNTVK
jgi:transposase